MHCSTNLNSGFKSFQIVAPALHCGNSSFYFNFKKISLSVQVHCHAGITFFSIPASRFLCFVRVQLRDHESCHMGSHLTRMVPVQPQNSLPDQRSGKVAVLLHGNYFCVLCSVSHNLQLTSKARSVRANLPSTVRRFSAAAASSSSAAASTRAISSDTASSSPRTDADRDRTDPGARTRVKVHSSAHQDGSHKSIHVAMSPRTQLIHHWMDASKQIYQIVSGRF